MAQCGPFRVNNCYKDMKKSELAHNSQVRFVKIKYQTIYPRTVQISIKIPISYLGFSRQRKYIYIHFLENTMVVNYLGKHLFFKLKQIELVIIKVSFNLLKAQKMCSLCYKLRKG